MIGGAGERKTLRLVAQYADACNLFGEVARRGRAQARRAAPPLRRRGRDYATIRKTVMANNPRPTPDIRDEFVRSMADYARLGIDTAIITPPTGSPSAWIEAMTPAVKQLAEFD